jgi:glutamate transport system permease protein
VSEIVLYDHPGPRAVRAARIGTVVGLALLAALMALVVWRLADRGQFTSAKWDTFANEQTWRGIGRGLRNTIKAAVVAILLAVVLGVLLVSGRLSEHLWLRIPAVAVIEFFRAIPVLMLMFFFFLAYPDTLGSYGSVVAALTLYNGAVLAEIFRAGILAVPKGQSEAAYSIGLRKSQVMTLVLVPQAARTMMPAIASQCVVVLKDTSLGFLVVYNELLQVAKQIYVGHFNVIPTVLVIAPIYIGMNMTLSWLAHRLEARQRRRYGRAVLSADSVDVGRAA